MAIKKTKPEIVPLADGDNLEEVSTLLIHPDLKLESEYIVKIKKTDARQDEEQYQSIDLKTYWLPPNHVYLKPQQLVNRKDLISNLVLTIDKNLMRAGISKSRNARIIFAVSVLAKLFEFMWLRNKFSILELVPDDFESLAKALAEGGWHEALYVPQRLKSALNRHGHDLASLLIITGDNHLTGIRNGALGEYLGTNIAARETACYLKLILENYKLPLNPYARSVLATESTFSGMKYSLLRQTMGAINLLFDLEKPFGLSYIPYPNPTELSKKLTQRPLATKNLGALEAGALISEAYKWIYKYSPGILELLRSLCLAVQRAHEEGRETLGHHLRITLKYALLSTKLEKIIKVKINGVDVAQRGAYSVRDLLMILMSACFVITAVMNARRRDEVSHRKYGLHAGYTKVIDKEMEIYEGYFYIEKTIKDYEKFYINKSTRDAALILEKIQKYFNKLNVFLGRPSFADMPKRERSLFSYHRFSRVEGVNPTRNWYVFEAFREGAAYKFVELALGKGHQLVVHPHMFRRMYALVLMYQHEIPSLQACSQQLAHDSLATTQIYVNDPISREESERIRNKLDSNGKERAKRFASHLLRIQKEVAIVRDERLIEIMLSIVGEEPSAGGYPNYIKRLYRRLMGNVDFTRLTIKAKAERLTNIVKLRGQFPTPYRHGICMVGTSTRAPGARCKDHNNAPAQENASPGTCSKCPFHFHNQAYLRNLESDLTEINKRQDDISLSPIEREQLRVSKVDLEIVIAAHKCRLYT